MTTLFAILFDNTVTAKRVPVFGHWNNVFVLNCHVPPT